MQANSPAGTTLNIEGTRSVLQKQMRKINCSEDGDVYTEGPTKIEVSLFGTLAL